MHKILLAVVAAGSVLLATHTSAQSQADFEIVLLGTGTPPPLMHRFGPATLVRVNGKTLLFDAGRGATQRMWQKRVRFGQGLDYLILTHLHSDHVVGIPDIFLTGWLGGPFGRRKEPMKLMGPPGSAALARNLVAAYDWDIQTRIADQKLAPAGATIAARDIQPGVVYAKDGVKITAFKVDHGGGIIDPVYGYRIDYDGRAAVISGDTVYNETLIAQAKGVDVLIHSIGAARKELLETSELWRRIMAHHITPEDAGRVFNQTRPKLAVFSHIVAATNGKIKPVPPAQMAERTRAVYDGRLVVGKDLMSIVIGKDEVAVHEHAK
jgi:ribonuclease Z